MKRSASYLGVTALATILGIFSASLSADAMTLSTDSSGVFSSETNGTVTGNFVDVPTPNTVSAGASFGGYNPLEGYASLSGVAFSTTNAGGNVNVNSGGFYGSSDLQMNYLVNSTYAGALPNVLTITLPHPETAFALDFDTLFKSTDETFVLSNGFSTTVTTPSTLGQTDFLGFVSTNPFTTITLTVPNGQSLVVADFTQANAIATPIPSSWMMMLMALIGFVGLTFLLKKQSKLAEKMRF